MRLALTGLVFALISAGCDQVDVHDHPQLKTGEQFYDYHCASCHKRSGEGAFMQGIPALKFTSMKIHDIVKHILGHGRADDTRMPRYSDMSVHEAERIAVYIRRELRAR